MALGEKVERAGEIVPMLLGAPAELLPKAKAAVVDVITNVSTPHVPFMPELTGTYINDKLVDVGVNVKNQIKDLIVGGALAAGAVAAPTIGGVLGGLGEAGTAAAPTIAIKAGGLGVGTALKAAIATPFLVGGGLVAKGVWDFVNDAKDALGNLNPANWELPEITWPEITYPELPELPDISSWASDLGSAVTDISSNLSDTVSGLSTTVSELGTTLGSSVSDVSTTLSEGVSDVSTSLSDILSGISLPSLSIGEIGVPSQTGGINTTTLLLIGGALAAVGAIIYFGG